MQPKHGSSVIKTVLNDADLTMVDNCSFTANTGSRRIPKMGENGRKWAPSDSTINCDESGFVGWCHLVDEVYTSITSMMGFRGSASMAMVEFEGNNQPLCLIVSCNACNK
jgi:hypothetical protein